MAVGHSGDDYFAVRPDNGDGQADVRVVACWVAIEGDDRGHRVKGENMVELAG